MNPEGFISTAPLPRPLVWLGEQVALAFKPYGEISSFEGLMIIISSAVMLLSIVVWIAIDVGNRYDKRVMEAMMEHTKAPTGGEKVLTGRVSITARVSRSREDYESIEYD